MNGTESLPSSTSDVKQEVQIRKLAEDGYAALPSKTVMQVFADTVQKLGNKPALHQKIVKDGQSASETDYTTYTWKEYHEHVDGFGKALLTIGCEKFDIINILGFNSTAWFFANFGAMAAGCVPAGIYTTNNADACKYISQHSHAKVIVVEGVKQLEKYYETAKDLPHLKAIVMYGDGETLPTDITSKIPTVKCYTFEEFIQLGKTDGASKDKLLKERTDSWKPGETCTLIYTSGTTGPPKAVMITNDNITWTVQSMLTKLQKGYMDNTDQMISYLPLSHIAAQMLDMHIPMYTGTQIWFAQPDALKGSLGATLKEVRPTVFFGVPRVWEKIYDKLQEVAKTSTGVKKMLSTWAKKQAAQHWASKEYGSTKSSPFLIFLANKLLHKAHLALGFDRCYAFYVSAAPIEVKILKYFHSLNIPIMELFGQSECTGPHDVNSLDAFKLGTVGRPLPGTETKLGEHDGELCYRGRHIFAGYMGMPDKTKETIDSEGWLHSGDVVKIDDDDDPNIPSPSGFVSITGRIKELIITAGGENIPPVLIEEELKDAMPALSNVMVIGDKRKYLTALFALQVDIDLQEGVASNKLTGHALDTAKEIGSTATTTEEAKNEPQWTKYFEDGIKKANEKAHSRAQKVGKYTLIATDFTEKGGELTPTLKLKRAPTAAKYHDVIEAMYA